MWYASIPFRASIPHYSQLVNLVEFGFGQEKVIPLLLLLSRRPVRGPLTLCILFLSAYAAEPLRTAGLLEAAHQYSLQDMWGSARTPIPTDLPIQE